MELNTLRPVSDCGQHSSSLGMEFAMRKSAENFFVDVIGSAADPMLGMVGFCMKTASSLSWLQKLSSQGEDTDHGCQRASESFGT